MSQTTPPTPPLPPRLTYLGSWTWRQPTANESAESWIARTRQIRARLASEAAGWLQVGQRVLVHHEARVAGDVAGQVGTLHRVSCTVFADYATVRFEPTDRQRVERTRMLPLEFLEPVEGTA